ncbi:Probable protein phosphatase 2C 73 [Linum grandiflorum]
MGHLSAMFKLARTLSLRKGKNFNGDGDRDGRETAKAMEKEAKKNELVLRSSGCVHVAGSKNLASLFSRRGEKGVNQDCFIFWEEFGCQEDMTFCGIFDGHGPWGHFVAKKVRESLPSFLLCNWQEFLAEHSIDLLDDEIDLGSDKKLKRFNMWKNSYMKACASVDQELERHRKIDSFHSGTTALTIVRQAKLLYIANVGDSRAVLATTSDDDDGSLVPIQLTVDFKPSLPQEAERIEECKGRVFCLADEPGVQRVWLPDEESPGLAMSRAFGDHCVKDFGLISEPEVTQRHISSKDQFVIMATDGVWDVVSNQEAVQIVSSTPDRSKAAKCLVKAAAKAWRRKRKGIAMDDISAVCLFLHSPPPLCHQVVTTKMV